MPSLLKKSANKAAAARLAAWHPNFRDVGSLPDTKAVRTTFFINLVAGTVVAALLLLLAYRELSLHEVRNDIVTWEAKIADGKAASDRAIASYKEFQAEEKKAAEVTEFRKAPLVYSDLLIRFGATLPKGVRISRVNYTGAAVNVSAVVEGSPEQASAMVSEYVDILRKDEELSKIFDEVALPSMARSADGGRISIELTLRIKQPPAAKPARKK